MFEIVFDILSFFGQKLLSKILPDKSPSEVNTLVKNAMDDIKPELNNMINAGIMKAQAGITANEANSIFKFVAYARSALLWVCIGAFVYSQMLSPLVNSISTHFHFHVFLPSFNSDNMIALLYALLGISTIHHVLPRNK